MGMIENHWRFSMGRRQALVSLATMLAGSPLLRGQQDPHGVLTGHKRVPGIDEMMNAFDFEPVCFGNMTLERFDYMAHGDGSEYTLRRNRQAFDWVDIVPGTAVDPKSVDLSTMLLGVPLKFPVYVAPSSGQGALHPDGEVGMYRGAAGAGTIMAIASGPSKPHPEIAKAAAGSRWNQFYPIPDMDLSQESVLQYQDLGTKAIIITVDQQASVYERDLHDRNLGGVVRAAGSGRGRRGGGAAIDPDTGQPVRGGGAGRGRAAGPAAAAASNPITPTFPANSKYRVENRRLWYNWGYVNELRKSIKVPVVIKGIVTGEDAAECARQGVDAIIVSNHGGRSMDYGPSTLEVLPEIVSAVNGRIPVIVDSGFRRGSDVFKALALGASAVELGRAARWGLGAFGAAGTQRLLEIIQQELVQTAAMAGRRTLKDIDKSAVRVNFV
jgi:4-hydroxymandelate oxidase